MPRLTEFLRRSLLPEWEPRNALPLVRPGLYHFHRELCGEHMRYHLRVDEGEPCLLIAAASEAVFLSRAGASVAKAFLEGRSPDRIARALNLPQSLQIVDQVVRTLNGLGRSDVRYPIFNLLDPGIAPLAWRLSAPFQADLEVSQASLARSILDRLWEARIPHVRFWITPRTDRQSLVRLIQAAEDLGMIAGVRCPSARWLGEAWIEALAGVGLDYVVLPWGVVRGDHDRRYGLGDWEFLHQAIPRILNWEMTPVAAAGLVPGSLASLPDGLTELSQRGLSHVEVFAIAERAIPRAGLPAERIRATGADSSESSIKSEATHDPGPPERGYLPLQLRQLAGWIEDLANSRHMQIVWLPTHARNEGESLDTAIRRAPRCGGDVSIRVDSAGNVFAPRGPWRCVGNLITDEWPAIWADSAFARFHGRASAIQRCRECTGSAVCAVGCPSDSITWVL